MKKNLFTMKKILCGALVVSILALTFGCGSKQTTSNEATKVAENAKNEETKTGNVETKKDNQKNEVKETEAPKPTRKFIVGFDAEYPPFGYLADDGKTYTGFDLELAQEVCKRTNMEYEAKPIDWDAKDMELNSGSIDCIWNGFTKTGREKQYTWTKPYIDNSIVLVVKEGSDIEKKEDLAGKVVVVQTGSSGLSALESDENKDLVASFAQLEQTPDYNTAFMNLESGMVDCVVVDIGVAKFHLSKNTGKFVQIEEPLNTEQYAIGFKKGNLELRNLVESTIIDMYNDGTFMKIAEKYSDFALADTICLGEYINK